MHLQTGRCRHAHLHSCTHRASHCYKGLLAQGRKAQQAVQACVVPIASAGGHVLLPWPSTTLASLASIPEGNAALPIFQGGWRPCNPTAHCGISSWRLSSFLGHRPVTDGNMRNWRQHGGIPRHAFSAPGCSHPLAARCCPDSRLPLSIRRRVGAEAGSQRRTASFPRPLCPSPAPAPRVPGSCC